LQDNICNPLQTVNCPMGITWQKEHVDIWIMVGSFMNFFQNSSTFWVIGSATTC